MDQKNLKFFVAVHRAMNLTQARFLKIKKFFTDDWEKVFKSDIRQLQSSGIDRQGIENFLSSRQKISPEKEIEVLKKIGARILIYGADDYPKPLENIPQPPVVLLCRGRILPADFPSVSVVGSRKITSYGKRAIEKIVGELAEAGLTIVSGLAAGTDILAQKEALKRGSRTIGVLGNSIDTVYPASHKTFVERFLQEQKGAVLSEYFPGAEIRPENFPVRNRIVTGLSRATIIIEAAEKSGSLISAQLANDQGKEVFAVPGEIFAPQSEGANRLILNGEAHPALSGVQILDMLGFKKLNEQKSAQQEIPETGLEGEIIKAFGSEQKLHINDLIRHAKISAPTVSATLAILEIKGLIRHLGNQIYAKNF